MKSRMVLLIAAAVFPLAVHCAPLDDGLAARQAKRYDQALRILVPLANAGNDEAQRIVGEMCFKGEGMRADPAAGFKWMEVSASAGNSVAQYNLGYMYETGQGAPKSFNDAVKWYRLAAGQGYAPAARRLGDLYAPTNRDAAIEWYNQARLNGDDGAREKYAQLANAHYEEAQRREAEERAWRERERQRAQAQREDEEREAERERQREESEQRAAHARWEAENARARDSSGPTTAQIIMGQMQKNAAEARASIAAVNRSAEVARVQAQQAEERERWQRQQEADRRAASARSSSYASSSSGGTPVTRASDTAAQRAQAAEREKQREEREREQEKARQVAERAARDKADRERIEKEKAERAERERAEKAAEAKAKDDYLRQMASGVRLYARTCPDGEHRYYVVGTRPRVRPEVVSCIDVHYEAICEGSVVGVRGVVTNFLGAATDCFMGDAAKMESKPACGVKQVRMVVREVRACGF